MARFAGEGPRSACIVGIGETRYAKWGAVTDRSEFALACDAILAAAADAGIDPQDIDGFASFSDDRNEPSILQTALGTRTLRFASMVWGGGGGGSCGALAHACAAVESGLARCVVVFRGLCQGQQFRFGQFHPWTPHGALLAPFGLFSPPQMAALAARRHMHVYGTTAEQFGRVALACRANAQRNPNAVMRGRPMTMDDYLASRTIASPLKLLDCCLESDGACALIVTTRERARDLAARPVAVLAAQGCEQHWGTGIIGAHAMPDEIYATGNGRTMAAELFARAGLSPADVDVAQLYDAFTITVMLALEDYGFCGRGESGAFMDAGHGDWPNGRLPLNTSGGNLSEAYVHGLNLAVEGVRQMRGTSHTQVPDAEVCFVSGAAGVAPTSAAILARE